MANFCTLNPLAKFSGLTLSKGNLTVRQGVDGRSRTCLSTMPMPSSGKFYMEFKCDVRGSGTNNGGIQWGLTLPTSLWWDTGVSQGINKTGVSINGNDGNSYYLGSVDVTGYIPKTEENAIVTGDMMMLAYDADTGKVWLGKNGVWGNNGGIGNPATGVNPLRTLPTSETWIPAVSMGTDSGASQITANFGQRDFLYTPPSGFVALNTENLPEPTISNAVGEKPSDYFNTVLWTGNGTSQNVTGVGFEPDFVWVKERSSTSAHALHDIVRGITKRLQTNGDNAEVIPSTGGITAVNSDGFSVGADGAYNQNSQTYVAWCWKAGGTPVSNTNGSITSSVSANTTAGFSIVGYTGNDTAGATIGHGLSSAPDMMIVKKRSANPSAENWTVYHTSLGATKGTYLNLTATPYTLDIYWNDTAPTSSVFSIGQWDGINTSGEPYIAYCWHSVPGFSKFGSYTGNGSTDGPFVYTGFKPAFIMVKHTDGAHNWQILDNARDVDNPVTTHIHPNLTNAEANAGSAGWYDSLSNGFKVRATYNEMNISGSNYIYMAFAEDPFKYGNSR